MYILFGLAATAVCCTIQFIATLGLGVSSLDLGFGLFFGVFFSAMFVSYKITNGLINSGKKDTIGWHLFCIISGLVISSSFCRYHVHY